jgi:hypothetical protein
VIGKTCATSGLFSGPNQSADPPPYILKRGMQNRRLLHGPSQSLKHELALKPFSPGSRRTLRISSGLERKLLTRSVRLDGDGDCHHEHRCKDTDNS